MVTQIRWLSTPSHTARERLFEAQNVTREQVATPPLDVIEHDDRVEVQVNLPGVSPEAVNIEFENGILTITAVAADDENLRFARRERYHGAYRRVLRLSETLNTEGAEATFANGVLVLTLPRKPEAQPVRIPVIAKNA